MYVYVLILPNKHQTINHATFLAVITYLFLLNEAIANVPTYLLSSSAFLSIKLEDFIVPEANLVALLTLVARIHFAKFHFPLKYLTGGDILFIKLESLGKKSIPDWHLYITQMEKKWTKWYAMTSHVIPY